MDDSGLITERKLNRSFIIFIGGLIGSIFGIMGAIGTMMRFSERVLEKYNYKILRKYYIKKTMKSKKRVKDLFKYITKENEENGKEYFRITNPLKF